MRGSRGALKEFLLEILLLQRRDQRTALFFRLVSLVGTQLLRKVGTDLAQLPLVRLLEPLALAERLLLPQNQLALDCGVLCERRNRDSSNKTCKQALAHDPVEKDAHSSRNRARSPGSRPAGSKR